ncbi:tegument protein [Harp seal herpesvirus]|uniref:Tegument protein n=1 Tax=phocid gammaherpesvirus 3 TaxID=2560643 RepID=A0A0R5WUQ3_9GAMA|nr:tegument protein [Harp seal herpesvirus]AJG42991.1 tegument protein [Harp seal herpesvirus]
MALSQPPQTLKLQDFEYPILGTASSHQGDCKYGPHAGSQCLSNCVSYLLYSFYNKQTPVTNKDELDTVLQMGAQIDSVLRESNRLEPSQFAQLSDIPGFLVSPKTRSFIFQSMEIFGLLGTDSAISDSVIMSMKAILSRNYGDITQYFIFICRAMSMALVIKNNSFFLFNPHCLPETPSGPAHVLALPSTNALISYLGGPNEQYTGCFLFFVPEKHEGKNAADYILNTYKIPTFQPLNQLFIDVSSVQGKCLSLADIQSHGHGGSDPSQPQKHDMDTHATGASNTERAQLTFSFFSQNANKNDVVFFTGQPKPPEDFEVQKSKIQKTKNVSTLSKNVLAQPELCVPLLEATIQPPPMVTSHEGEQLSAAITASKRKRSSSFSSSISADVDINFPPLPIPTPSSPSPLTSDDDEVFYTDQDQENLVHMVTERAPAQDVPPPILTHPNFTQLDSGLQAISNYQHLPGYPIVRDKDTGTSYRTANVITAIDKLITGVVLEHGLVSSQHNSSPTKNLLMFLVLWGQKLNLPTSDLTALIECNLEISKLFTAVSANAFEEGDFIKHITSKLLACCPKLHTQTQDKFKKALSIIQAETKKVSAAAQKYQPSDLNGILTSSLGEDGYLICNKEDQQTLISAIQNLKTAMINKNESIDKEADFIKSLIFSVQEFQPHPPMIDHVDTMSIERDYKFAEIVETVVQGLTKRVKETAEDFETSVTRGSMDTLYMPDFNDLMSNITSTIRSLTFCIDVVKLDKKSLSPHLQQVMYMGGELASLTNTDWPFRSGEAVVTVKELSSLKTKLQSLQKEEETDTALQQILDDIDNMLQSIHTTPSSDTEQVTQTLTISMLENYIANASALVSASHNTRYQQLKEKVESLASSESFLANLINTTTLYSVAHTLAKVTEALQGHPHLRNSEKVIKAFKEQGEALVNDAIEAITSRDITRLDHGLTTGLQAFLAFTPIPANQELGQIITDTAKAVLLKETSRDSTKWANVNRHLGSSKSVLATANISAPLKRKLYTVIQKLSADSAAQEEKEKFEQWKQAVDAAQLTSMNDVYQILNAAYDEKSKSYAEKVLQERVAKMKQQHDTQTKEAEKLLIETTKQNGEKAWAKIFRAFENSHFDDISATDWKCLSVEFARPGSSLLENITPKLFKVTDELEKNIAKVFQDKVNSFLPNSAPFISPELDWVAGYKTNISFYLKQFSELPKIQKQAQVIETLLNQAQQAISASDLQSATVGTHLETPAASFSALLQTVRDASKKIQASNTHSANFYIEQFKNANSNTLPPIKPVLQAPKKLFLPENDVAIKNLPEGFQKSLLQVEITEAQIIKSGVDDLEKNISNTELQIKMSQEELNLKLSEIITVKISKAPVIISSKPLNKNDPVHFLESIVRDKPIINSETYKTTLECLTWVADTQKRITPVCPSSYKQRLNLLDEETQKEKLVVEKAVALENTANVSDDIDVLTEAIEALDSKRVVGGKPVVDTWVKKKEHLQKIVLDLEHVSAATSAVKSLAEKAKYTMFTRLLTDFLKEAQTLLDNAKKDSLEEVNPTVYNSILELQVYIKFKLQFIAHYEDSQKAIFQVFPIPPEMPAKSGTVASIDLPYRLSVYGGITKLPLANIGWLETLPTIDPVPATLIPPQKGPPIHLQPIFENFLEACIFKSASGHHKALPCHTLPVVISGRLGVDLWNIFLSQLKDVFLHSRDVLTAFVQTDLSAVSSAGNAAFLSMVLFTHMALSASHRLNYKLKKSKVLSISFEQWLQALLTFWPQACMAFLSEPSMQDAVQLCRTICPALQIMLSQLSLENNPTKASSKVPKNMPPLPPPRGFIFRPSLWEAVNIEELFWKSPKFHPLCIEKASEKARLYFLLWGLLTIQPEIINQLWCSLKPVHGDFASPHSFFKFLVSCHYPHTLPSTFKSYATSISSPYTYGAATGTSITVEIPVSTNQEKLPVTAFEVAMGSLLCNIPIKLFLISSTPWIPKSVDGDIFLVTPLLDCTGTVEPCKSFFKSQKKPIAIDSETLANISGPDELEIFKTQVKWLQHLSTNTNLTKTPEITVMVKDTNFVDSSYTNPQPSAAQNRGFTFIVDPSNVNWPTDIIQSNLEEHTPNTENVTKLYKSKIAPFKNLLNPTDVFTVFPKYLLHKDVPETFIQPAPILHSNMGTAPSSAPLSPLGLDTNHLPHGGSSSTLQPLSPKQRDPTPPSWPQTSNLNMVAVKLNPAHVAERSPPKIPSASLSPPSLKLRNPKSEIAQSQPNTPSKQAAIQLGKHSGGGVTFFTSPVKLASKPPSDPPALQSGYEFNTHRPTKPPVERERATENIEFFTSKFQTPEPVTEISENIVRAPSTLAPRSVSPTPEKQKAPLQNTIASTLKKPPIPIPPKKVAPSLSQLPKTNVIELPALWAPVHHTPKEYFFAKPSLASPSTLDPSIFDEKTKPHGVCTEKPCPPTLQPQHKHQNETPKHESAPTIPISKQKPSNHSKPIPSGATLHTNWKQDIESSTLHIPESNQKPIVPLKPTPSGITLDTSWNQNNEAQAYFTTQSSSLDKQSQLQSTSDTQLTLNHQNLPSISNNYVLVEDIANRRYNPQVSLVTPILNNISRAPIIPSDVYQADIETKKQILIAFIRSLKDQMIEATNLLVQTIEKIKYFYL